MLELVPEACFDLGLGSGDPHPARRLRLELRKNSKMRDGLTDHNGEKNLLLAGHVRLAQLASQTYRLQILPFCRTIPKSLSGDLKLVSAKS
jgi:hypothetical protein